MRVVDEEVPPYGFIHVRGRAEISEDPEQLLRFATEIGARYMGVDRAEEFGTRNAVPGELLIRVTPEHLIATATSPDTDAEQRSGQSTSRFTGLIRVPTAAII